MWGKAPLLLALVVLGTYVCFGQFVDINKNLKFFAITVEYVVFWFNQNQSDEYAYKFLQVRRSQRQLSSWTYLADVEMGRTMCKKHDDDIDNCPLQQGSGEKKVRCTFIIRTLGWVTQFLVLNSTCTDT